MKTLALLVCLALPLAPIHAQEGARVAGEPTAGAPDDAALEPWRVELLERAFRVASALPVRPHIKNRSRAQEAVVAACLELGAPARAESCALGIENWRRAVALADIATHLARHERRAEAQRVIELVERTVAERGASEQEWQDERIRARVAAARVWLGDRAAAARLVSGVGEAELGVVQAAVAGQVTPEDADARFAAIDAAVKAGGFDSTRNALEACALLHRRCYTDAQRRARAERTIRDGWSLMPLRVRIDLLASLAEAALEHGDAASALERIVEARASVESAEWLPEDLAPLRSKLALLRFRAGDVQAARREVDAALAAYERDRGRIVDIFRAGALRPVAEAYAGMQDIEAARAVYARVLDEGALNPNSRPRAEDLVATCCSMARAGVAPDERVRERMVAIEGALGDPW